MLPIQKKLIKYNYSSGNDIKYIVIHDTGNSSRGADAEAHYRYFNGGDRQASAHYFVDDHSIIQVIEDSNASWHCGDGGGKYGISNHNSIGIEICINSDGNYDKAVTNTIELVKHKMAQYNVPIERIVRHYDASRKNCPASMSTNGWAKWNAFKAQIQGDSSITELEEGVQAIGKVIAQSGLRVRDGANIDSKILDVLPYGTIVKIGFTQGSWHNIYFGNHGGWISADYVEIIKKKLDPNNKPATPESLYRVRKTWEDAKSQVGAYKVLDNAKTECDKYHGYSVYNESGKVVYNSGSSEEEQPTPQLKGTEIMGQAKATIEQMEKFLHDANPKAPYYAKVFIEEGALEGVRGDIAFSQAIKETGYFRFGGDVKPEQNNFSGLGATGGGTQGATFKDVRTGIRAQIQHLKAYASQEGLKGECVDPRFNLVKRGSAPYVEWLGAKNNPNGTGWAWPGEGYGFEIITIIEKIFQQQVEENIESKYINRLKELNLISKEKDSFTELTWAEFAELIVKLLDIVVLK
ncbi:N-acetylmuramoyl-L-alanine amidase [Clostridium amazonitimonense]|uniref:N-acetylmuramoyl-L-alanine amidase n=1 Tax=Clostridium amazonitimonense TaxID=1499689 RepID=UPI0009DE9B7B|nr:N-acetylmuramoyl-L-alanine amidase [Clostridium amazonitimonense]